MITAKRKYRFDPDYAVPPGKTLSETLKSLGMPQNQLAIRTGLSEQTINRIIKATQPITPETANKFELATGVPARLWNNLEAHYREQLAKLEERAQLQRDLGWLKTIPIRELIKRGEIPDEKDRALLLHHTLAFYGVSSVAAWQEYWDLQAVAARRSQAIESHRGPTSAWIRLGEIRARGITCQPYDKGQFISALQRLRALTVEDSATFVPQMLDLCAGAGVAVSLVPEMPKAPWYGASKWLTATKAMMLLSLRGKRDDQFWFSFFHEAGHILQDSKKDLHINEGSKDDPREEQVNKFATTILIPANRQHQILLLRSHAQVRAFASELGIAPGIVVGQFERMTGKWGWFAKLKRKYVWS